MSDAFRRDTDFDRAPAQGAITPRLVIGGLLRAWLLGLIILAISIISCMIYLNTRTLQYTATAVVEPPLSTGNGQISGQSQMLASFVGIDTGGNSDQFTKYLQILSARRFAAKLESDHHVLRLLFPGWDESSQSWKVPENFTSRLKKRFRAFLGLPNQGDPDIAALDDFLGKKIIITLVPGRSPLDLKGQVFTVSITMEDRELATNLLMWSLSAADSLVRHDQLARTVNRIAYLRRQIDSTNEIILRQSLSTLLTQQEQAMMTLQTDKFYAVDLIDPPSAPNIPLGMTMSKAFITFVFLGFLVFFALVIVTLYQRTRTMSDEDEILSIPFPNPVSQAIGALRGLFRSRRPNYY